MFLFLLSWLEIVWPVIGILTSELNCLGEKEQWRTVRVFPGYSPSGEIEGAVNRFENLNEKQWGMSIPN